MLASGRGAVSTFREEPSTWITDCRGAADAHPRSRRRRCGPARGLTPLRQPPSAPATGPASSSPSRAPTSRGEGCGPCRASRCSSRVDDTTSVVDNFALNRSIKGTFAAGFSGTYFPGEHIGLTADAFLLGLGFDDSCRLTRPAESSRNAEICDDIDTAGQVRRRGDPVHRCGLPLLQPGGDLAVRAGQRRAAVLQSELRPDPRASPATACCSPSSRTASGPG